MTGFTFFDNYYELIDNLPEEDKKTILAAIVDYMFKDETPELTGMNKAIFNNIKIGLDASKRRARNKNATNSKPTQNQNGTNSKPTQNQNETNSEPEKNQVETELKPAHQSKSLSKSLSKSNVLCPSKSNKQITKVNSKPIHPQAVELAELLKECVLKNYPNNRISPNYTKAWGLEIQRMHELDGRSWEQIKAAIMWSAQDSFWQQNIWSGKKLREHYDKLEAGARAKFLKNGVIQV